MNTRQDKIELLKEISRGNIKPEDVPPTPTVVSKREDWFLGLMMIASVSPEEGESESKIIFIGEASKALEKAFEGIKTEL